MTALDILSRNRDEAVSAVAQAEVAVLRAAFPFQRNQALESLGKAKRSLANLETLCERASVFEDEDEVAFLENRPTCF